MKFTRSLFLLVLLVPLTGCIKSVVQSGMPKLEAGQPTGTLYVGYRDKTLPSGTRVVVIDNNAAFRINMGQYTKIKLNPGNYKIRLECVRVKGFHGMDSALNTSFQMAAGTEVYFMIKWDASCKKPAQDHIRQVVDKDKQALIKSYKLVSFKQSFAEKEPERLAITEPPCCDISGHYRHPRPYRGEVTIKQTGAVIEMVGRDMRLSVDARIAAETRQPHTPGPQMKVVAKIEGQEIKGEWWYVNNPSVKKPFSAHVFVHKYNRSKVKSISTSGELSGVWNKDK